MLLYYRKSRGYGARPSSKPAGAAAKNPTATKVSMAPQPRVGARRHV
jgi:hypothetical protein